MGNWLTESGDRWLTEDGGNWVTEEELYDLGEKLQPVDQLVWIPDIEAELLAFFKSNPESMYEIPSRTFEELVSAIFRNQGFDVELTPPVKDGGFDILAVQHSPFTGDLRFLIECKRYSRKNKVSIGIVRQLLGVLNDENATKGIIVTTSFFTKPAIEAAERHKSELSLSDYDHLVEWLNATIP